MRTIFLGDNLKILKLQSYHNNKILGGLEIGLNLRHGIVVILGTFLTLGFKSITQSIRKMRLSLMVEKCITKSSASY